MYIHYMDCFPGHRNYIFYISPLSFHKTQNKIFKIYVEIEILLRLKCWHITPVCFCQKEKGLSFAFIKCVCFSFSYIIQESEKIISKNDYKKLPPLAFMIFLVFNNYCFLIFLSHLRRTIKEACAVVEPVPTFTFAGHKL